MNKQLKKTPEIKPNLPGKEEMRKLWRERVQRGNKKMVDAMKQSDGRRNNPGRPRKWKEGAQSRVTSRVLPSPHDWLKKQARLRKIAIGEVIDYLASTTET